MAVFEFHCTKCGNVFEKLFRNSNDSFEIRCPECKDENIVQLINPMNYPILRESKKNDRKFMQRIMG